MKKRSTKVYRYLAVMRKPDRRMIQTNYHGRPDYWITPDGIRVEAEAAQKIINHPQVVGGRDALFPGIIRRGGFVVKTMRRRDDRHNLA